MKPDTLQSYGSTTRFLHWTIAACYLFMFATVIAWNIDENLKFLINSHKAVGILLLILSVWRVATVFFTPSGKNTKTQIKPSGYRFRQYRFRQNNHASGHSI
ncbi:TPA: cytochrome b/b6 domain-containing protein, partial [Neisseria meningitidis]